ncbi:MAG: Ig-like domain-containing protein [Verrucomicrobia bacterium]|nr:Ig-like domain-containing protein [Verrucomicrobiota bacterium]
MLALGALISAAAARAGVLYDLAADWSTNQNPFGVWSLYKSESALFTIYQPGYGWADQPYPETAHVPVWSLGEGGTNVVAHSAEQDRTGSDVTKARWTSPTNGVAKIRGCIWMPADLGRRVGWQLRKNGIVLTSGEVYSGDPYDAANPCWFELGSGGPAVLTQPVLAGDYLELALISLSENGNLGQSVGVVFQVELTPGTVLPTITRQPSNQVVLVAQDVTFQVGAVGSEPLAYQWFFSGGLLAGATNAVLNLPQVTTNQAGNYFALVSNLWGVATSQVATLTVLACGDTLPNLVAWWPADSDANDRAGSHHGTLHNGAAFAAGKVGAAFSLDGADDYIDTGRWTPGSTWTVAAWVKPSAAPAGRRTILGGAAECADWGIVMQDGVFGLLSKPPSGCTFTVGSGVQAVPGTWYFVVGTCDGSTARIYVDGELRASAAVAAGYVGTSAGTRLGNEVWCNCDHFPGLIDEPMVFNRALVAEEIVFLFASANCAPQRPLIFQPPASQVVLATRDVTFLVGAVGSEPLAYQWFFNGGPLAGATNAVLNLPLVSTNQAGPYFVVVSNLVGAVTSQVAVLTVLPDTVGPAVVAFTPSGVLNTNVSRLTVQFDERINMDSFTAADLSVVTPGGALNSATFTIQPVAPGDGTAFEVLIPSQSLEGDYTVRIGPFITDLSGNLMVGGSLFESQEFTSLPGHWTLLGHAAWNSGGFVRLTPATTQRKGSLVLTQPLPAGPFVLSFDFHMSNGGSVGDEDGPGADGIALNILSHVPSTPFFYGEGDNAPAFHLFLDSYGHPVGNPGDTNGDHIAIGWTGTNGSVNKAIQVKVPQRFIDTGLWHAEVEFDGAGLLTAHITSPTGAVTHVSQIIPVDAIPPQFYFGFGAYTGGGYANQDVDNVLIRQLTAGGEHVATFTIDKTGPSITSVSPSGIVSNTMTSFEVNLDSVYAASSISTADVTISGPNAPAVQSVSSLSATSFRVTLAGPLPQGDFTITIGPEITDLAGNPMAAPFQANLTIFLPDLTVSSLTAPASALAGQPLNLGWTVTNLGPGHVIAAWKSRVQLATNAAGEGAVTLASFTATNLLAAGTALSQTGLVILPATAAGNRWLVVTADADNEVLENTETNNAVVAAVPVTLLTPDLALAGLSAPASAQFGQTIAVTWAVTNVGTASAAAAWSDRVYLSAVSNSIAGATPLVTVAAEASPLPAGGGYARSANVTLPLTADSLPGTFWLVAVADYQDAQPEAAEANNLRSVPLALDLPPLPDLAVTDLIAPASAAPGVPLALVWTVTNAGTAVATGPWTETVYLSGDTNLGSDMLLGSFTVTNVLTAGEFLTTTQAVTMPTTLPWSEVWFLVVVDSDGDLIELAETNNAAFSADALAMESTLTLHLPVTEVSESAAAAVIGTVTRSGSLATNLEVTLTSSDTNELRVPATVTIPAGAAMTTVDLIVVPDNVVDGPKAVLLTATAPGVRFDQAVLRVLDADRPQLTLTLAAAEVIEGQPVAATVTRTWGVSNELAVLIESLNPGHLAAPGTVTLPAGSNSVTFDLIAVDDSLVEAPTPCLVTASAPGFLGGSATLNVLDDDWPQVTVSLANHTVSENAGAQALLGAVTRNLPSARPLSVELVSSNPAAATVPALVVIPGGETTVQFVVTPVDDAVPDGPQTTEIGGFVLASGSATRLFAIGSDRLTVTDDDGPALGLTAAQKLVREGLSPATTFTVTRNTPPTNALTVTVLSSDLTEATVPASVVIPPGQPSATFALTTINDGVNDGNQTVTITAAADGFAGAAETVTVTDTDLPDLVVAQLDVPPSADSESSISITYRVANQGFVPAGSNFLTRVFLSHDATVGDDTLVGQYAFNGALPSGQYFEQTLPVRMPRDSGSYWLIVQTDPDNRVAEGLEDNNTAISRTALQVGPAYRATVETDVTTALAGTPVPLRGRATNHVGSPVPFKLVNIHVLHKGARRIISAVTDADGNYAITWTPLPGEAGYYEVGADHPGVSTTAAQDAFRLLGMKPSVSVISHQMVSLTTLTGAFQLENLTDVPLQALQVRASTTPDIRVEAQVTNTLPASGSVTVSYSVTSLVEEESLVTFTFIFTTAEGVTAEVPAQVIIEPLRPRLAVNPGTLNVGVVRGQQRLVELEVVNVGGAPSSALTLSLPAVSWLQVVSTNPIPPVAAGATNRFALQFLPPADLNLGEFTGTLGVSGDGLFVPVPFKVRVVSDARGSVRFTTVDEATYHGTPLTNLAGVTIILRDQYDGSVVAQGQTDAAGELLFENLPEGTYNLEATAPRHDTTTGTVQVKPGELNDQEIFLRTQVVRYTWTVEEIEIEDRTRITLETTFETTVPAPVVTVEPNVIDLAQVQGDEAQVDLKITNHGLIAAQRGQLVFGTHPDWTLTPLVSDVGELPARSSITVPLLIKRVRHGAGKATAASDSKVCEIPAHWEHILLCGPFGVTYKVPIWIPHARWDCGAPTNAGASRIPFVGETPPTSGRLSGGVASGPMELTFSESRPFVRAKDPCACEPDSFSEACWSAQAGFRYDLAGPIKEAVNAYLNVNAPGMKLRGLRLSSTAAAQLCTCCAESKVGLKAKGKLGLGLELIIGYGLQPEFTKTLIVAGEEVQAKFDVLAGLEFTAYGTVDAELSTKCHLRDLKLCLVGTVGAKVFAGFKGSAKLTVFVAGVPTEGTAKAAVGYETGLSLRFSGCNDGSRKLEGCFDGLVAKLELEGSITLRGTERFIKEGWTEVLLTNRCCTLSSWSGWSEGNALASAQTDSADAVAQMFNYTSAAELARAASEQTGQVVSSPASAGYALTRPRHVTYVALPPRPVTPAIVTASAGEGSARAASGAEVCAQVRLQLEQEAVLTRKAIGATLEIINESDTLPLTDLNVAVSIYDENGNLANDRFVILPPELTGLIVTDPGVPGTNAFDVARELWAMPTASTGRARWIILPTDDAAPEGVTRYYVGGSMSYRVGPAAASAVFVPVGVNVYPNARLRLRYFHDRDVFSDDPFTEVIEPSVPFSLAVLVENVGRGEARNFRITSAEPRIVENEKGLLIDFQIIASEVAGRNTVPSLTMNLGDIGPGSTVLGRWLFTSTLQGLFVDYRATFEHEDSLGGRATSLIEDVTIHEMIHLVQAGGAFEDGRPDFLVNDLPDPNDRPDTLYLSDGSTNLVEVVETAAVDAPPGAGHLQVHLTAPMPAGWAYLRVPEPGDGQFLLRRVVRSDGAEISVGTNAWSTDRTFIGLGRRPIRENILHLLDHNSPGSYTLHYEPLPAPDTTAPDSQVAALPAASREAFPVQWSGADDSGSVAGYDVFVSVNGGAFVPWLQRTRLTSAVFQGEFGSQYAFYSRAVDAAGNREEVPATPDAQTTVSLVNHAPAITPPADQVLDEGSEFRLTPVVTDEDVPADRLTFSLLAGPPGLTMDAATGQMRWLTGEAHGPSTNIITWVVRDDGVPSKAATNTFRLVVNEVNSAPVLSPIQDATVLEGRWLIVTNVASDADLPAQQLTWSLVNPPAGAMIDPASGLFRWRPSETQGGVTNTITVVVRDNGPGSLAATQTFRVTVVDALSDFALGVGTTNLLAGEAGFVPLGLVAGVPLTNVSFTLTTDEAALTNLVLQPRAPGLSASSLERVTTNLFRVTFALQPGSQLLGTQELARLSFYAPPREDSTVVHLDATEVLGIGSDGTVYDNGAGKPGRVFVIARQPIVADLERSAGTATLTLYGRPGQTYLIESTPALRDAAWLQESRLVLSNTWMRVSLPEAADAMGFYRALETSDAGSLTARLEPGRLILEWPVARPNCMVEETSHLGAPTGWTVVTDATMELTNGLARVHLIPTSGTRFYRLRCD